MHLFVNIIYGKFYLKMLIKYIICIEKLFLKFNCGKCDTPLRFKCYTLECYNSGQNQKKEKNKETHHYC